MKLNHVKVNYYKSFGEASNNLQVEDDITVIVGKNESGKSNLLQLLSKIDLLNGISNDDLNKVNRKYSDRKPNIELKFKLDNDEKDAIKNRLEPIVRENIKNNLWEKTCEILDLFSELYIANKEFNAVFKDLLYRDYGIIKRLSDLYQRFQNTLKSITVYVDFINEESYDNKFNMVEI